MSYISQKVCHSDLCSSTVRQTAGQTNKQTDKHACHVERIDNPFESEKTPFERIFLSSVTNLCGLPLDRHVRKADTLTGLRRFES